MARMERSLRSRSCQYQNRTDDVVRAAAKRGAIHEAHNLLGAIRRLYT